MAKRLNVYLQIRDEAKSKDYAAITELHKLNQKKESFNGFEKTYEPKEEGGTQYPPENLKVQNSFKESLKEASAKWSDLFDIVATVETGNMQAKADVKIGDVILIKDAPVTFLLQLEKSVADMRKYVDTLPVLDPAEEWADDEKTGLFKSKPVKTHRTEKIKRPIVLYDAVDKHPAQTQLIEDQVLAGYWTTVKFSGGIPATRKKEILERVDWFARAVKSAREEANMVPVEEVKVGETLFKYLFG